MDKDLIQITNKIIDEIEKMAIILEHMTTRINQLEADLAKFKASFEIPEIDDSELKNAIMEGPFNEHNENKTSE